VRAWCEYPRWEPSKDNPGGDCRRTPPTMAAPLGSTGRYLALCPDCAGCRPDAVPIGQVEEP
jgi:hypothetical protein